jgi:hypothetical protein
VRRRLFNLAAALSLVLSVAAAVFWVLSYFTYDVVGEWPSPAERRAYGLISTQGTVCFAKLAEQSGGRRWASRHDPDGSRRMQLGGTAGFVLNREPGGFIVGVPYWLACSLLASPPRFDGYGGGIGGRQRASAPPAATTAAPRPTAARSAGWRW